jgi:hypothetical protein
LLAGVSTNLYVPDSNMNGPENGPDNVHDTPNAVDTNAADTMDAANTADADAYEILAHTPSLSGVVIPEEAPAIELSEATELPEYLPIQWEANSELAFNLVIDCFPLGNPGAPILGTQQDPTIYESTQAALGDSIWAPFRSKCDWEIAHWAKMHGPTSLVVMDLLAISEVCGLYIYSTYC